MNEIVIELKEEPAFSFTPFPSVPHKQPAQTGGEAVLLKETGLSWECQGQYQKLPGSPCAHGVRPQLESQRPLQAMCVSAPDPQGSVQQQPGKQASAE